MSQHINPTPKQTDVDSVNSKIGNVGNTDLQSQVDALNSNYQQINTKLIQSSTTSEVQTFNLKGIPGSPLFLFSAGFYNTYVFAFVILNSVNQSDVQYKEIATVNRTIQNIVYNKDTRMLTITLSASMYRRGSLLLIQNQP